MPKKPSTEYLELLYSSLRTAMQAHGKLKNESLLLSALEMTNNSRLELLTKSALGPSILSAADLSALLEKGLVMESAEPQRYALTGRGIWELEKGRGLLSEASVVAYLDERLFPRAAKELRLGEKEKVILLAFAAARCYGAEQPMDLHQPDTVKERWVEIFLACYDCLKEGGLITRLRRDEVFGKKRGNEHPVSNLVRHTDALPPKTKGIYKALGNQQYCLTVTDGGQIMPDRLAYLFRLLLGSGPDPQLLVAVADLCRRVANDDCIYIFNIDRSPFFNSATDEVVRASIMRAGSVG